MNRYKDKCSLASPKVKYMFKFKVFLFRDSWETVRNFNCMQIVTVWVHLLRWDLIGWFFKCIPVCYFWVTPIKEVLWYARFGLTKRGFSRITYIVCDKSSVLQFILYEINKYVLCVIGYQLEKICVKVYYPHYCIFTLKI